MTEVDKPTFDEAMDSLTGFEEEAIGGTSGYSIEQMANENNPRALLMTRCVAAVLLVRQKNMTYGDAYLEVKGWPQSRVQGMFAAPPPPPVVPDEPDSESGKGEPPPLLEPATWPSSASPPE